MVVVYVLCLESMKRFGQQIWLSLNITEKFVQELLHLWVIWFKSLLKCNIESRVLG